MIYIDPISIELLLGTITSALKFVHRYVCQLEMSNTRAKARRSNEQTKKQNKKKRKEKGGRKCVTAECKKKTRERNKRRKTESVKYDEKKHYKCTN